MTEIQAIEKALHSWTAADFKSLQDELDSKALEIQDTTKSSLLERKALATETKQFKTLDDELKLNEIHKLLKNYQLVIDGMHKRGKSTENVVLKVWRSLIGVPDPTPFLEQATSSVNAINELESLRLENSELKVKLVGVADYEKVKADRVKIEERMLRLKELEVKAMEDEWKSVVEEKEREWNDERESMMKKIMELEVSEKMMKIKLNKVTGGEEGEDEDDEEVEKKEEEETTTPTQLDAANGRITSLEKRNEELRREISSSKSNIEIAIEKAVQEKDKLVMSLEGENALISAKLDHERTLTTQYKEEIGELKTSFNRQIKQFENEIEVLKKNKNETSDYEELKKELEMLKQIQFGDDEDVDSGSVAKIESAIVSRNKKLNNEVVEFRRKFEESDEKCSELLNKITILEDNLKSLKETNNRLENDLINFDHNNIGSRDSNDEQWETMSMISSVAGGSISNGKVSPAASLAGTEIRSVIGENNSSTSSSLLPIITQQRDRFRSRNKELEEENKKNFGKLIELKREINNLKIDNRQLYEKIRFLEYHKTQESIKKNISGGDIENRYRSEYENELHPIEQFRILETQRINSNITPWDRIFIQVTRTVLSTPFTRWLFVAYCLSLHFLVMILLMLAGSHSVAVADELTSSTIS